MAGLDFMGADLWDVPGPILPVMAGLVPAIDRGTSLTVASRCIPTNRAVRGPRDKPGDDEVYHA